jgi:hypothetical protein
MCKLQLAQQVSHAEEAVISQTNIRAEARFCVSSVDKALSQELQYHSFKPNHFKMIAFMYILLHTTCGVIQRIQLIIVQ